MISLFFCTLSVAPARKERERKSETANYSPFIWIGLAFVAAVIEKSAAVICSVRAIDFGTQMLHSQLTTRTVQRHLREMQIRTKFICSTTS
jgi:hypothetical protein